MMSGISDAPGPRPGVDCGLSVLESVLCSGGVAYWIDSGVLLGLARSGGLNPWEKDIDLAIEGAALQALLALEPRFREAGYEVTVNRYRGVVFNVALTPGAGRPVSDLLASVHVYYSVGDYLWSPQAQLYVPPPAPDVYRAKRSLVGRWLKHGIERALYARLAADKPAPGGYRAPDKKTALTRAARWLYRRIDRGLIAETWPLREIYVPLTWVIPRNLVLPLGTLAVEDREYPVPADIDGYLALRYGDWRQPVKTWCYWTDDGAIRNRPPMAVRDELLQESGRD